jgi:hypothetical protein
LASCEREHEILEVIILCFAIKFARRVAIMVSTNS